MLSELYIETSFDKSRKKESLTTEVGLYIFARVCVRVKDDIVNMLEGCKCAITEYKTQFSLCVFYTDIVFDEQLRREISECTEENFIL